MNSRCVRLGAAVAVLLLFSFSGFAQQSTKKRWTAATLDGTSGLFKTWDAETLRGGEFNLTFGWDKFTRDPGEIDIGRFPVGGAIGIMDRFEFFGAWDVQRDVESGSNIVYRRLPGDPPFPAQLALPNSPVSFNQTAPFIDVPEATGRSDIHLGVKFNFLAERRGDPLSLGFAGFGTIPGQKNSTGLSRGLSNGAYAGGFALLFSKSASEAVRFHVNAGTNFVMDPEADDFDLGMDLQNEFIYRGGVEFPAFYWLRGIVEVSGVKYYGDRTPNVVLNPKSPIDFIAGLRIFPREWLSLGAAYQATLHQEAAGYSGFIVQGTINRRRNDPPTLTCAVANPSILQADTTTIRANAVDPDGDKLTYSWSATGGKVSGKDDTATFDATGVAPGKYTVTVTVSDGKHQVTCSADITVLKRNQPPTARVEPSTFDATQGDSVNLRCIGSDPNNDPLTYSWTVDGQRLASTDPQISFGTEGRKPGNYTVTCTVSDGEATASANATGTVRARVIPNKPPTIECLTTTMDVAAGGTVELRARASDPDNDKLNYSWSSTGGSVSGSGDTATFNAAGVTAGSYTVTVTVDDGRGGKASCSMTVYASERISVTKEKCGYFTPGGARVDNCAKAILDDLATRMKNDPRLKANVIGYTDDSRAETRAKALGEKRAKAVAAYLEKQGVESSRLTITDGGANNPVGDNKTAAGKKLNRRVEIELTAR